MQGKVKWFSDEKGYGYITAENGTDYYFNVRDVQGADLPRKGDIVTFNDGQGKKGPRASSVVITSHPDRAADQKADDRVICPNCGKRMIPRLITGPPALRLRGYWTPVPKRSVCPFCGGTYKEFKSDFCFIATAVYCDPYSPKVIALRRFRDETLSCRQSGRLLIAIYYRLAPAVASVVAVTPGLSACIRPLLNVLANRYD
jgi:cold shock CspA family protein